MIANLPRTIIVSLEDVLNFIPICVDPSCRGCTFKKFFSQGFCDETAHTASVNHQVRKDFALLDFCIKGFELFCSITRDGCHLVIGIAVIIVVVDLSIVIGNQLFS